MRFVQSVLILVSLLSPLAAQRIHYVKPSNYNSTASCPGQPCLRLGQYANTNFTTGSTFVFLAGNHSLQTVLNLTSVFNVILRGFENSSTIALGSSAFIACNNVSNLHIERLTFVLCTSRCEQMSALQISNCRQIIISGAIFKGSSEAFQVRSVYAQNSTITVLDCLFERNSGLDGGAIYTRESLITVTGSMFTGNVAQISGGAIRAIDGNITLAENVFVKNSASLKSGAVNCENCILTVTGINTFESNRQSLDSYAGLKGGAMYVSSGTLIFTDSSAVFANNGAYYGGAIGLDDSHVSCSGSTTIHLNGNRAKDGGGMHILGSSDVQMSECNMVFVNNSVTEEGGAIHMGEHRTGKLSTISGSFFDNRAKRGGAVFISEWEKVTFVRTNISDSSGSAMYIIESGVNYNTVRMLNNTGQLGGGIYSFKSMLSFEGHNMLHGNTAPSGGGLCLVQGRVTFAGSSTFYDNSANGNGGALYAVDAIIDIQEALNFTSNTAENGGAMYLNSDSFIAIGLNTIFVSSFNRASGYGGGVYYVDNPVPNQCSYDENTIYPEELGCLFHSNSDEFQWALTFNTKIASSYDTAGRDGGFLYGGLLDRCQQNDPYQGNVLTMYEFLLDNDILTWTVGDNETQAITSEPYALCFCDGVSRTPDCTGLRNLMLHRGQKFTVHLLAIAQGGVTSTTVTALTSNTATLRLLQNPQNLPGFCSTLSYNLYSTETQEQMTLYPEGACHDTGYAKVVLDLTLLPCPDGFIQESDGHCVCEERLQQYNVSCIIDEDIYFMKQAGSNFWMGASYVNGSYEGLVLHETCPVEYCKTDEVKMSIHELDVQCAPGRTGVLCGGCADNYSLLIGSSKCKACSNAYLALLLPFATIAGIVLVAFLSILRLTVATGMINGLILYANIVQVNRRTFFPPNTVNILTVFIAWLNLDLGFETCFYDKMNAFSQTCLQFAFPVYVWVLISLIIVSSRYSVTLSKLIGHNPIAVLATLLLMSYTKILNIIIEVYSSVELDTPQDPKMSVWLKDANVPYLRSKHLALTVVTSLVLIFFFFPYTLLVLLGHTLYRFSGKRQFRWLNRLKPLLDSYHAPYKTHGCYWTGFLLLIRCALYIVFSFNSLGGTHESLLAVIITFTALGLAIGFLKMYKKIGCKYP